MCVISKEGERKKVSAMVSAPTNEGEGRNDEEGASRGSGSWFPPPAWVHRVSHVSVMAMLGVVTRAYVEQAFLAANVTGIASALFTALPVRNHVHTRWSSIHISL